MANAVSIFMCGDVMTGRGIDQVLPHPSQPRLYESWVKNAREYVRLAEQKNGTIEKPVEYSYIWGDALHELKRYHPAVKLINLETSITTSPDYWQTKGIHYRMHPQNMACLSAAGIDCCSLANNHVLDWGYRGLEETLDALHQSNIKAIGAGRNLEEAKAPAILATESGRVLILALGMATSGIFPDWGARYNRPGVHLLPDLSRTTIDEIAFEVKSIKRPQDILIASIHWGDNWGYEVPRRHIEFAHALIDGAQVDVVHGHSSHHPLALEVYRDRLILYGCGDFINDYEGISGHEHFRGDLTLMFFLRMSAPDGLIELELVPMHVRNFRLQYPSRKDAVWLTETLNRECASFGTSLELQENGKRLRAHWA